MSYLEHVRMKKNHCDYKLILNTLSQLAVKQQDFASPSNINNLDGIENGRG